MPRGSNFQQLRLPLAPSLLFPPFQLTDLRAAQICVVRCPSAMGRSSVLGRHKEVASESESSRLRGGFTRDVNVTLSWRNPVAIPIAFAHWRLVCGFLVVVLLSALAVRTLQETTSAVRVGHVRAAVSFSLFGPAYVLVCYVLLDPPRNIMEQRPDLRFCCMCLWLGSTTVVAVQLVSLMMICVLFSSKKKERPGTTQLAVQRLPRVPDRKVAASSEAAASRLAAPGRLFFFSERGGKGQFCTFVLVGWFASESRDFWVFAARVSLQN